MTDAEAAALLTRIGELEERLRLVERGQQAIDRGLTVVGEAVGMDIMPGRPARRRLRVIDGGDGGGTA